MKVWITGAGGMMGSHLAEMLLAAGHDVYATYCRPTIDPSDLQFNGAEVDITDWCSVYDSIATFRPDAVFHLAAQSYPAVSWARPVETLTTNMVGTAIVFEALRRVRPHAKIIVAGSSAEYGFVDPSEVPINERRELRPLHPYGVSKAATDMLAYQYHKSYGMHNRRRSYLQLHRATQSRRCTFRFRPPLYMVGAPSGTKCHPGGKS